ncbi:WD40-repeat-containing domain protein [Gamsiella multidivaricata]|uniref:WD40-repeat-containing domain protein n=1 Tax=Gamsiella multidivaricata TaxID=101098 RepID=UPI00222122F1|nr:WD40-repeat-containing domain protein [Gamsiella multidivaricata]KAI7817001.1 WD40-repeat-containing domain protein [Gamsiella multidivaricata]
MNSIQHIDELVKEYLLFRGFTSTYKAFEADSKTDKDKGFQACIIDAEKIIEELFAAIAAMDLSALLEHWRYLDIRYFSRLDHRFAGSVKKFELCLLRYYLIYAIQHKKKEKIVEFFDTHGAELQGNPEWVRWFALPFSKKPEADPEFDVFFSKAWLDTFTVSLHNFLSTVFQNMPLPSLLCFNIDRLHRKALQCEVETLQSMIENLRREIQSSDAEISSLRDQVALKKVTGARRRRAASMVEQQVVVNTDVDSKSDAIPKRSGSQSSHLSQTSRLAISNARRLRAASDAASRAKYEVGSESSATSLSEEDLAKVEEPFIIVSQEIFLEHQSGITHAKFSCEGSLISSCDAENIVRIWSYNGSSAMPPAKIASTSNILSLAWETRDRYIFLGTDVNLVRCFSLESRSIVHEIKTDAQFPSDDSSGALLSFNMKSMTTEHTVLLDRGPGDVINAVGFNHNGQLVVTGDVAGMIRIYDIRSLSQIMEWSASSQPILSCTFSFDETSIYSVDAQGQLSQDSVHKSDHRIDSYPLQGFTSSTLSSSMMMVTSSSNSTRSVGGTSIRSKTFIRTTSSGGSANSSHIPRIQLENNGGTVGNNTTSGVDSSNGKDESASGSAGGASATHQSSQQSSARGAANSKDTSALTAMNVGQGQLLGWSGDTDHLIMGCGNAGVIVQTNSGQQVQPLLGHSHPLTCVDWSAVVGACLTGSADGTIRISKLMRV